MKYFTHGFIYIQDMIERGIVRAVTGSGSGSGSGGNANTNVTNNNSLPGTYMQQFPYPCYIYDT